MGRIKLNIPEKIVGIFDMQVRITDINYGNHVGNDAMVGIVHEARVLWLQQLGYSELNIEGSSIIMSDLAVNYINESFHGDLLHIEMAIGEISTAGFELYYHLTTSRNDSIVTIAKAKTGLVFYNYPLKKIEAVPPKFLEKITTPL